MAGNGAVRLKLQATNLLTASVGWLGRSPGHLRILTFHDVSDGEGDIFGITRSQFGQYVQVLRDEGYVTIRARDMVSGWPSWVDRQRVVLLTFDDCYASHRDVVAEILGQHGMTATFFAISSLVGAARTRRFFEGRDREFLSAEDLLRMELDGFEVGSHTHTHPMLGRLTDRQVAHELAVSKLVLEQVLRHAVSSFAYPYGRQLAFSHRTRAALKEAGYGIAFTQAGSRIRRDSDLLEMPRTSVDRLDTMTTFRRKLEGHYDLIRGPATNMSPAGPVRWKGM